ncbi:hypothetical protein H5410_052726 [Solanum commersonii]|uniref:GOLD domain-containing protein n=1 Tax=Solanum commersonii TaxID=4109 RepID=A0A9J5X1W6_SOLCO|nr:hypothetical protein H5410_052726 [Solanum commersonii]
MASTDGLMPITRAFLSSYYDKYPFSPLSQDVSRLTDEIHSMAKNLQKDAPLTEGESSLVLEAESHPPHKVDENLWKNREQLEEILFLLESFNWPPALQWQSTTEDVELVSVLGQLGEKFRSTLKSLQTFQSKNSEFVFNTVMTYMPQDFRGTLIRQQRERSERNKQAEVDALINSGGSVYKTLVKYLVGVPQVLLDFVQKINDDDGPMEEQRQRYGPPLYSLTKMVLNIRLFLSLLWRRFEAGKLSRSQITVLEEAVDIYTSEFQRFITFIRDVFANSPFFITAEEAGTLEARKGDEYKEVSVPAGKTHEVSLTVDAINSYIAWDFSLVQGRVDMDIGFSMEYTDPSGQKTGNFCTCLSGNYKLIWDNSYSTFFKKVLRYKVDCIPPVVEPELLSDQVDE